LCPCNTCEKRKFQCIYTDRADAPSPSDHPSKRRLTDSSVNGGDGAASFSTTAVGESAVVPFSPDLHTHAKTTSSSNFAPLLGTPNNDPNFQAKDEPEQTTDEEKAARSLQHFSTPRAEDQARAVVMSNSASQGGQEEEAVVYSQTRMLQDPTGRLCKAPNLLAPSAIGLLVFSVSW
jgi:hypothetical protein